MRNSLTLRGVLTNILELTNPQRSADPKENPQKLERNQGNTE